MKSEIILIRHGITTGNEQRMYYGKTDVPLTERGMEALKKNVREGVYPDHPLAQYFTTGMLRTEQTMEIIYGSRPHGVIEKLQEINFGEFEMQTYDDLKDKEDFNKWLSGDDNSKAPPGGESIDEFNVRVGEGFEELKVQHELHVLKLRNQQECPMTICVCHGGVISGVLKYLWPEECDNFFDWIPDPGHGYIIDMEDGKITGRRKF